MYFKELIPKRWGDDYERNYINSMEYTFPNIVGDDKLCASCLMYRFNSNNQYQDPHQV